MYRIYDAWGRLQVETDYHPCVVPPVNEYETLSEQLNAESWDLRQRTEDR